MATAEMEEPEEAAADVAALDASKDPAAIEESQGITKWDQVETKAVSGAIKGEEIISLVAPETGIKAAAEAMEAIEAVTHDASAADRADCLKTASS